MKAMKKSIESIKSISETAAEQTMPVRARKQILVDLLYTIIVCIVIALLITLLTSSKYIVVNFVMSFSVGLVIYLIATSLHTVLKPRQPLHVAFIYLTALCGGVLIGMNMGPWILQNYFSINMIWPNNYLRFVMISVVASSVATYFFYSLVRIRHSREMIEEERISRMAVEKDVLEAKLKMLQAQIEPHFLFNTLSNVVSLIDTQPVRGKAMLLDLTKYLRTSLSRTLPDKTMLDQEIEMIEAYLNIQKMRMDERLKFKIDVPDLLRRQYFPPMLLQPLVENALKHGLEPKVEGGEIMISAAKENNIMRIEVADTGMGFSDFNKAGVGIANVRERLALLFGEKGSLTIEENKPQGVRAIIEVPTDEL